MHVRQKVRLEMFRRGHQFLSVGEPLPSLVAPLGELEGVIQRLDVYGVEQDQTKRRAQERTASIRQLTQRLRSDHMRPITLAAKAALHLGSEEGGALIPSLRNFGERDYVGLLNAARGMAQAAEPHSDRLVASGLPKDFIARLTTAADALQLELSARSADRQRRVAVTEGMRRETLRGFDVLRLLDSLATQVLRSDPVRLAEWKAATRLRKVGQVSPDVAAAKVPKPSGEPSSQGGDAKAA